MGKTAIVLATLWLAGCSPWVVNYEPRSLRQSDYRIAKEALLIPPGDLEALAAAGGEPQGTLYVGANEGWVLTGGLEEVHEKAREEAAKKGASHIVYLSPDEERRVVTSAGKIFNTTVVTSRESSSLRGAKYFLVRVPEKNWTSLDPALRPTPSL